MKQYFSIGALLIDYRHDRDLSQLDLSSLINVDIRTIQRWEKDITLIKPDKEKEIAEATLLPYQLIRNLNAAVPIPTYYDYTYLL
jgi:transcriptional regulator with XRE-family HTH domain